MEQTEKKEPFYNQIEKYIIVCMFLVMTVIIALNVVTRFVFNFTLSWGEQLARLLLVWTSFAGISWAGKINAHMRVTALSLAFKKNPKVFEAVYLAGGELFHNRCCLLATHAMIFRQQKRQVAHQLA